MTRWTRIHKIETESPGFFFSEEGSYVIGDRTVEAAVAVVPDHVFRFRFFDALTADVEVEGESQTVRKTENFSPWHYLGGTIYTLAEIEDINSTTKQQYDILLANMRGNRWERVIQTPLGNWHPWEDDFVLVPVTADSPSR